MAATNFRVLGKKKMQWKIAEMGMRFHLLLAVELGNLIQGNWELAA